MDQNRLLYLLQRSQMGDREAQGELLAATQDRVYYHCRKLMPNEQDALDATQDVLLTILTHIGTIREPAAYWGWVNSITANRCKRVLTAPHKEWQIPEYEDGTSMVDQLENLDDQMVPEAALDNAETRRLVMELVDSLPPEQRICVLYYYYDEMTIPQIAWALGVPEGTVKSRLNYARKSIKTGAERLKKQGAALFGLPLVALVAWALKGEAGACAAPAIVGSALAAAGANTAAVGAAAATAGTAGTAGSGAAGAAGAAAGAAVKAGLGVGAKIAVIAASVAAAGTISTGGYLIAREVSPPAEAPEKTPIPVIALYSPTPTPTPTPAPEPTAEPTPEPTPEPSPEPTPEPTPEAVVMDARRTAFLKVLGEQESTLQYAGLYDLNGDGIEDLLLGFRTAVNAGTGWNDWYVGYVWSNGKAVPYALRYSCDGEQQRSGIYRETATGKTVLAGYYPFDGYWWIVGIDGEMQIGSTASPPPGYEQLAEMKDSTMDSATIDQVRERLTQGG